MALKANVRWLNRKMRKVFSSAEMTNAKIVRDLLAANEIDAILLNENTSSGAYVGIGLVMAEVWVQDESQFQAAKKLVRQFQTANASHMDWPCATCDEINPGTFDVCWNCDSARPD